MWEDGKMRLRDEVTERRSAWIPSITPSLHFSISPTNRPINQLTTPPLHQCITVSQFYPQNGLITERWRMSV